MSSWRSELKDLSKHQAKTPAEQQAWVKGFEDAITSLQMAALKDAGPMSPDELTEWVRVGERRLAWKAISAFGTPDEWRAEEIRKAFEDDTD